MKTCKNCKKSFSEDNFWPKRQICKLCYHNKHQKKICETCGNIYSKTAKNCKFCKYKNGKYCNSCKKNLPTSEFSCKIKKFEKVGGEISEYYSYRSNCKKCESLHQKEYSQKNPEIRKRGRNLWNKNNPDKAKMICIRRNLRKWNTPEDQIESLTEKVFNQKACECCGCEFTTSPKNEKHMDHCHEKNIFRGVICRYCNHTIGHSKEKIKRLKACVNYLEKYYPK
jgi:hypothetical protein